MLPFGSSINCAILWQVCIISSLAYPEWLPKQLYYSLPRWCFGLKHIHQTATTLSTFLIPIAPTLASQLPMKKTVEPTHDLTFLGIELDLHNLTMQLPTEKLNLLNTSLAVFFLQAKESVLERIVVAYWSIKLCVQGSCTWPWFLPAPYKFNNRHNQTIPLNQSYKKHQSRSQNLAGVFEIVQWHICNFISNYGYITTQINFLLIVRVDKWVLLCIYFEGKWGHGFWPIPWAEQGIIRDMTFLEPFPLVVALILRQRQFANS